MPTFLLGHGGILAPLLNATIRTNLARSRPPPPVPNPKSRRRAPAPAAPRAAARAGGARRPRRAGTYAALREIRAGEPDGAP